MMQQTPAFSISQRNGPGKILHTPFVAFAGTRCAMSPRSTFVPSPGTIAGTTGTGGRYCFPGRPAVRQLPIRRGFSGVRP